MAIEKMRMVTLSGDFQQLDNVLSACLSTGCFEPENTAEYMTSLGGFSRISEENPCRQPLDRLTAILAATGEHIEPAESQEHLDFSSCLAEISSIEAHLGVLQDERAVLAQKVESSDATVRQFEHFAAMDIPLENIFNSKFVSVRFGRLPQDSYALLDTYQDNPNIYFYPLSADHGYQWGMYVAPRNKIEEVDRIFACLFFERFHIPDAASTPAEAIEALTASRNEARARMDEIDRQTTEYCAGERQHLSIVYGQLLRLSQICELRKYAIRHNNSFVLMGWIPLSSKDDFFQRVGSVDSVELTLTDTGGKGRIQPPIKLRNNRLVRPFEFYTKMFGVPKYGEIDPTPFVAITYTLLYGIMFADVGQGILLSIIGYWMYRVKKLELGRLLVPCGISGAVFGAVFGSVFGFEHLLDPFYRLLGFSEKPIEVLASDNIMTVLLAAVGIGVVMMILALLLSIWSAVKQRHYGNAIFGENGLVGLVFYISLLLLIGNAVLSLSIPTLPLVLLGLVLPAVLLWVREPLIRLVNREDDWKPESWGEYLAQGFFEMFEAIISYLSNTISFLRVGAFVLVHASMMTVFFSIAGMLGGQASVGGIIVIIFGNVFVLALEGLLVGVQSLRLEFYEMFNRFYEGSGRLFIPAGCSN